MPPRIILLPHADPLFIQHAVDKTLDNIPNLDYYSEILLLSTDHKLNKPEHSMVNMMTSLKKNPQFNQLINKIPVQNLYVSHDDSPKEIAKYGLDLLTTNPTSLIIANSDLTHYGTNYGHQNGTEELKHKTKREKQLLDILITSDINGLSSAVKYMSGPPCGYNVIASILIMSQTLNYIGTITDYYDSSIISNDTSSWVSYVAVIYNNRSICQNNSVQSSYLYNKHPQWSRNHNTVFMGLKDINTGVTYASYGNTFPDLTVVQKIKDLVPTVIKDLNSGRLGGTADQLCYLYWYVSLFNKQPWKYINLNPAENIDIYNDLSRDHGFKLLFTNGSSSFFVPDVWRSNPQWTVSKIINELIRKHNKPADVVDRLYYFKEDGLYT